MKKILKSKLFKEIWQNYSKVEGVTNYYFEEDENIDDFLKRINFKKFREKDFGIQADTTDNLSIITSSLPISLIESEKGYSCYKVLELARKIIILMHEVCHYIKRALSLITNGEIESSTLNTDEKERDIIEAGLYFESLLFGWKNNFNKRAKSQDKNRKNKNDNNEENLKIINITQAIKILDPNTYNKTIKEFKHNFYKNEKIVKIKMDEKLKLCLAWIGFDLNDYIKNEKDYSKYTIDCSRKSSTYFITYESDNHNYLTIPKLKHYKAFLEFYPNAKNFNNFLGDEN